MRISIRRASDKEWMEHVACDENATFFQTPSWFRVWQEYANHTIESIYFEFKNGKSGVFPLSSRKQYRGWDKQYIASPGGTYGGPVSSSSLDCEEIKIVEHRVLGNKTFVYRHSPFLNFDRLGYSDYKYDFTHLIKLDELDRENVLENWRKGHKADAKRAIREGVQIQETRDPADIDEYYAAYLHSLDRWGRAASSFYRVEIFKLLIELPPGNVKLWKAVYNNKLIYGCLCFYHNNHVVYWHGAGLSEFFWLGAVHALQWKIIEDAIKRNFKFYDLNPSGGHVGVERFKDGFGAIKTPACVFNGASMQTKIINKLRVYFQ